MILKANTIVYKTMNKPWSRVRTGCLTWLSKTPNYAFSTWPKAYVKSADHYHNPVYPIQLNTDFKLYEIETEFMLSTLWVMFRELLKDWLNVRGYDGFVCKYCYPTKDDRSEKVYVLLIRSPHALTFYNEPVMRDCSRYTKYRFGYGTLHMYQRILYFFAALVTALDMYRQVQPALLRRKHQLKLEYNKSRGPSYEVVGFTVMTWNIHKFKDTFGARFNQLPSASILCLQECGSKLADVKNNSGKQSCILGGPAGAHRQSLAIHDSVMTMLIHPSIAVMNVHLSVKCAKKRLKAMRTFLDMFSVHRDCPGIILGDFNMTLYRNYNSDAEWVTLQHQRCFESEEDINSLLEDRGFRDVSCPGPTCWTQKKVDYIYANFVPKESWIDTMGCRSDHYALAIRP